MKSYEKPNFIKFDTIKIRTKKDYFKKTLVTFNPKYHPRNGNITGIYYSSKNDSINIPFDLFIGVSYTKKSLSIEFSSKILWDDYPKLITKDTFRQCLDNLNQLGICEIDTEAICKDCCFSMVHVTSDFQMELTDDKLDTLSISADDYKRYIWKHYEKSGITFSKDVKTEDCKEEIKIYNKEKEMDLTKNKKFLSKLEDPNKVKEYFKENNTRFEIILKGDKIKKHLDIPDTHIDNVFNSTANPILLQFNKIFGTEELKTDLSTKYTPDELLMRNTLLLHNHNFKKIRMEFKDCYKSRSGISDRMELFKQLSKRMLNETTSSSTVLSDIRKKLQVQ